MNVHIEVLLGILAPNIRSPGDTKVLLGKHDDGVLEIPNVWMMPNATSLESAATLLRYLTGLEARIAGQGWVNIPQIGLADNVDRATEDGERLLSVVYGCMIPETVQPASDAVEWYTLTELRAIGWQLHGDHRTLLEIIMKKV